MRMPSQGHSFSEVPQAQIARSSFNRSSAYKTAFDSGFLVPFFIDEALPGDTFNLRTSGFARMATPIYPLMDNIYLETFYFAVPYRLIWDNFEKFMGAQENPGDSTDYLVPQVVLTPATTPVGYGEGTLGDYFGLPTNVNRFEHSALFGRAYALIWNEWFRDQNLQQSATVLTDDGPDPLDNHVYLGYRGKRHDYFTSALPWPQKGPEVTLPLGTTAPIEPSHPDNVGAWFTSRDTGNPVNLKIMGAQEVNYNMVNGDPLEDQAVIDLTAHADLTAATAATVNDLRQAFAIQRMFEKDARGGTRYTEVIRSHFGVTSPDMRLQRPEYLGGGSQRITINEIHSTADTLNDVQNGAELGRLSAIAKGAFQGHGFTKSFTEHCVVIGLMNVRADLTYQQGLNRMFSRQTRHDFYWPELAGLGEQEVLSKEIFCNGDDTETGDNSIFGYQERYAEYRYKPNQITGALRSQSASSLDAWHLGQYYQNRPLLNADWIKDVPPIDRVVAVPSEPQFIGDFYHQLTCARPMPMFGVPGLSRM